MAQDLEKVQQVVDRFDNAIVGPFDQVRWEHKPGDETIGHIHLQLVEAVGKVAAYLEARAHGETPSLEIIDTEVIPDLLINVARLANDRDVDQQGAFDRRLSELPWRSAPASKTANEVEESSPTDEDERAQAAERIKNLRELIIDSSYDSGVLNKPTEGKEEAVNLKSELAALEARYPELVPTSRPGMPISRG